MLQFNKCTLRDAGYYITRRLPFSAGNLYAVVAYNGDYVVYSYATIMLILNTSGEIVYLNENRYSVSTSKHQSIIRNSL